MASVKPVKEVRDYGSVDARGVAISRAVIIAPLAIFDQRPVKIEPTRVFLTWKRLTHDGLRPLSFELVWEHSTIAVTPAPWSLKIARRTIATVTRNISDRQRPWVAKWRIINDRNIGQFRTFTAAIAWVKKDISRVRPRQFKFDISEV